MLEKHLIPLAKRLDAEGNWRLYQDNDPKHTSRYSMKFYEEHSIDWCRSPAESPDCNPIENLWANMKWWLARVAKPKNLLELITGILYRNCSIA
jgi:hypothetical protein